MQVSTGLCDNLNDHITSTFDLVPHRINIILKKNVMQSTVWAVVISK